jgi:hypothetical protein
LNSRELQRQQVLMGALWGDLVAQSWLVPKRTVRGLQAYTDHAQATAKRALGAVFSTVLALLGDDAFGTLARNFWHTLPPQKGDLAMWGDGLASFIETCQSLAPWSYLADCARLDWALHQAECSTDLALESDTLHLLAQHDPDALVLELLPCCQLISSVHPVVSIWQAHQRPEADVNRFTDVQAALAQGRAEHAFVWREGWCAQVQGINSAAAMWTQALLRGDCLGQALTQAGDGFEFQTWLVQALQAPWLWRVQTKLLP